MFAPLQRPVEVSSPAPKRKGLEIIGSIFKKKSKESGSSYDSIGIESPRMCSNPMVASSVAPYNFPPNSPVSPRVHNLKEDMDILTLSRHDNPYISSKLEEISNAFCGSALDSQDIMSLRQSTASPNSAHLSVCYNNRSSLGDASQSLLWTDDDAMEAVEVTATKSSLELFEDDGTNLHDHLIRSPPPQFPTHISAFVFPEPGSPLLSITSSSLNASRNPLRSPRITKVTSDASHPMSLEHGEGDRRTGGLRKPPLVRRASAGGQTEFVSCRGSPLRYPKRASSGPNIVKSPPMTTASSSRMSESESREALLTKTQQF